MLIPLVLSGLVILLAWTVFDVLIHRLLLRPLYQENTNLWRPFDQMNVVLIYTATFALIATFVLLTFTIDGIWRPDAAKRGSQLVHVISRPGASS
jgi:hypothetical protein